MSYTHNKHPKDPKFCQLMRRSINKDRKLNGFSLEEEANELGISEGTLEQKLKPSANNDFYISEMMHFMEMSGDYSPLEYLNTKYDFNMTPKCITQESHISFHLAFDDVMIESDDVFKVGKMALRDNTLDKGECEDIIKECEEAEAAIAKTKAMAKARLVAMEVE